VKACGHLSFAGNALAHSGLGIVVLQVSREGLGRAAEVAVGAGVALEVVVAVVVVVAVAVATSVRFS
jgi:hypothetical protein